MSYTTMKTLVLSLILFANLLYTMSSSEEGVCFLSKRYQVHVVNNLPGDIPPLTIHCASKDNNLGFHQLPLNYDFHWSFCENVEEVTLFFCHFWWGQKNIAFDVFSNVFSLSDCKNACYWSVQSDGFYFSGHYPPQNFVKKYVW